MVEAPIATGPLEIEPTEYGGEYAYICLPITSLRLRHRASPIAIGNSILLYAGLAAGLAEHIPTLKQIPSPPVF